MPKFEYILLLTSVLLLCRCGANNLERNNTTPHYNDLVGRTYKNNSSFFVLLFSQDKVHFEINPQCGYECPVSLETDTIVLLWEGDISGSPCMNFDDYQSIAPAPTEGIPFATLMVTSDSTIRIDYLFPEWTSHVNKMESILSDSVFPTHFFRID